MNQNQTESKPPSGEQPADEGLDGTTCSLLLSHADTKRVLNAVHERAWELLNMWQSACHASYRKPDGTQPTKAELDMLYEGQKAHFALQGRIQEVLKANAEVRGTRHTMTHDFNQDVMAGSLHPIVRCIDDTLTVLGSRLEAKQPMYHPDAEWNALMQTCESLRSAKSDIVRYVAPNVQGGARADNATSPHDQHL